MILESGAASSLRLVGVHRIGLVIASSRMRNVVNTTSEGAFAPAVEDVEGQRRVRRDGRMKRRSKRPGLEADAGDELAGPSGGREWHAPSVAGDDVAGVVQSLDLDLQPLDRGIDEARGAAGRGVLAEHVPGLERVAQLKPHPAVIDGAVGGEAELALRREPLR